MGRTRSLDDGAPGAAGDASVSDAGRRDVSRDTRQPEVRAPEMGRIGSLDDGAPGAAGDASVGPGGGFATATIFVTSSQYSGSAVGGLAGADASCRAAALAGGLANASHYVALMSDSATNAVDRFSVSGDIRLTDGALVAASSADLWSTGVMVRVNRTETGVYVGMHLAWTGTQPSGVGHGMAPGDFCQDWTSDSGGVETGRTDRSDDGWVAIYFPEGPCNACSNPGGIYCIGPR